MHGAFAEGLQLNLLLKIKAEIPRIGPSLLSAVVCVCVHLHQGQSTMTEIFLVLKDEAEFILIVPLTAAEKKQH